MKSKLNFIGILLLSTTLLLSSCEVTRDNYDPAIDDEEACRELVKVNKCMKIYSSFGGNIDKWFKNFVKQEIQDEFGDDYTHKEIDNYISCDLYSVSFSYNTPQKMRQDQYLNSYITIYNDFAPGKMKRHAEQYFYNLCESDVIQKNKESTKCENDDMFCIEFNKQLKLIFDGVNTPRIDWFADLINDDYQSYQVWEIGKESDSFWEDGVRITVFFNKNNERTKMRLFHSK